MNRAAQIFCFLLTLFISLISSNCNADQPMITDDAGTANFKQLQFYFYSTIISASQTTWWTAPALEVDYGLTDHLELHLILPYLTIFTEGQRASGLTDIEAGIKTVLMDERKYLPKVSFAPVVELPSGNSQKALGNGRAWYKFPLWLEKNWPDWKTYGGIGYIYNGAPEMDNVYFGGWVVQRNFSNQLQVSAEIYRQTAYAKNFAQTPDQGAFTLINFGVNYQWFTHFALQVSVGHNIAGVQQWFSYMGLLYDLTV